MAGLLKNLFGPQKPAAQIPTEDGDFADFAGAPEPSPVPVVHIGGDSTDSIPPPSASIGMNRHYTRWYRVWERTEAKDFITEGYIIAIILLLVGVHLFGTRKNRKIAKRWMKAHAGPLHEEFAVVGFGRRPSPTMDEAQPSGPKPTFNADDLIITPQLLKEKKACEFETYGTGRANIAFTKVSLYLNKRYNPLILASEHIIAFFLDSIPPPVERMMAVVYPFDGRESQILPSISSKSTASAYDNFVWAVVNKDEMKRLRDERYDVSLTVTKDSTKLPSWATVMTESAEITDILLTPDLIKAIEIAGDAFESLIVTDQPRDKPTKIDETEPKKRIYLSVRVKPGSDGSTTVPIFRHFLRMSDQLVSAAHFRPEVTRKTRQTREEEIKKLRRVDETEKAEERALKRDKEKKEKRDTMLKGLSAEEQRKFLEKEKDKEQRKSQKKMTQRA